MNIDEFVSLLENLLGEAPKWRNDSVILLMGETEIVIEYVRVNGYLYLYSPVARVSAPELRRLSPSLLSANLFASETGGEAALGYDSTEEMVVLWQCLSLASMSAERFREELSALRRASEHWRGRIRDGIDDRPDVAPPSPFPGEMA